MPRRSAGRAAGRFVRAGARAVLALTALAAVAAVVITVADTAAYATELRPLAAKPKSIEEVFDGLRVWVMGFLGAVATFFFLLGGTRYVCAGENPGEVEKAKTALKGACVGYVLALLAPMIIGAVKGAVT